MSLATLVSLHSKMVTFAPDSKSTDGDVAPGKNPMWLSASKANRVKDLLATVHECLASVNLSRRHKNALVKHLGLTGVAGASVGRDAFDACMSELIQTAGTQIPNFLRPVVLALRHALFHPPSQVPAGCVKVVCLFPVAASAAPKVSDRRYQFDSGWRSDGLFLWLGQRKRRGHLEVLQALEDPCGPSQAVLLFTRPRQSGCRHTFVGRVRGYLPVAEQDASACTPFRAALMLDASQPFELFQDGADSILLPPGGTSSTTTKASVHQALGVQPASKYDRQGFSVSVVPGDFSGCSCTCGS